jgi:hypothetical protein
MKIRMGFPLGKTALLKHPLAIFGKIAFFVGIFLFVLGIVIYLASGDSDRSALWAVSFQGVVWGISGVIFSVIGFRPAAKLKALKHEGKRFDAEISSLNFVSGINMGHHATVYAECIYTNENGQRCKVKTPMFLWKSIHPEDLRAEVYVDYNDPRRYAVEISRTEETGPQVDIDYT